MSSAGGPNYKWKGKNIRSIKRKNIDCVTMPRKDSIIVVPSKIRSNKTYRINIMAKNDSGNGLVSARFTNISCKAEEKYVVSKDFKNIQLDISVGNVASKNCLLEIFRPAKAYGIIIISGINIAELSNIPTNVDKKENLVPVKKIDINHIAEITKKQVELERKERIEKLEKIIKSKNSTMLGGPNFSWNGKNIRNIFKYGTNCVSIARNDSVVLVPVSVDSECIYRITVTATKVTGTGNGELLLNFFAGKGYEGPSHSIKINGSCPREYSINLTTPILKLGLSSCLRLWRSKSSSGNLIIKDIKYSFVSRKIKPSPKFKRKIFTAKPDQIKEIKKLKEDMIMKFRPYHILKTKIFEEINSVVISDKNQVPKVSIITPTRDNLELLKKCWNALNINTAYPNWEWIVGDSNSSDGTVEFMRELSGKESNVKFIERKTTEGSFSTINNELVKQSAGEYLLFLNDDTQPQPFWLYNMVSKIHHNSEIGIVGSKLLYSQDRIQHAGIAFMNEGPGNLGKAVLKSFPKHFAEFDRFYQAVTGACLLIRREDFEKVGGFDPEYWFCYDDIGLCLKIKHQLNKKILYSSRSEVLHNESVTQNKFKTSGVKQQSGITYFKKTWMSKVEKDFYSLMKNVEKNKYPVDVSFVTCITDLKQYSNFVVGSLFNNSTNKNYEIIPILNFGNQYSAARALNMGIDKSRGRIIVFLHQDVILLKNWVELLFRRIEEIEENDKNWGVLGTAGITTGDDTIGMVYNAKGSVHWRSTKKKRFYPVQTVDEHCMVIRKNSGLRFDECFDGFHMYGADLCLTAVGNGMTNYGILCPLVHDSKSSSLWSGKTEFMHYLNMLNTKWGSKMHIIRTPTSLIRKGTVTTFIKFG